MEEGWNGSEETCWWIVTLGLGYSRSREAKRKKTSGRTTVRTGACLVVSWQRRDQSP